MPVSDARVSPPIPAFSISLISGKKCIGRKGGRWVGRNGENGGKRTDGRLTARFISQNPPKKKILLFFISFFFCSVYLTPF